ncbi:MAG: aminoacyl-tRNA hydrolase [Bacilli bacterium]|jgi:PTH1 family peptidyl-tRNA hydrolase|nr:aminoacyl-tRNA hydrolase [Acholeplasmataceae bacterium]
MLMLVGLGNPGRKYKKTRHNIGFMFLDRLAQELGERFQLKKDLRAEVAEFVRNEKKIILLKPQTYMNLSGGAVLAAMKYYGIAPEEIVVIYDDMDLPEGKIRIRKGGSSGGHKGIKHIIETLNTEEIKRIRIGIGSPMSDSVEYVLSEPKGDGAIAIDLAISKAMEMFDYLISHSFDEFMGRYN